MSAILDQLTRELYGDQLDAADQRIREAEEKVEKAERVAEKTEKLSAAINRTWIRALRGTGKMSEQEIADFLGLSPDEVRQTVHPD